MKQGTNILQEVSQGYEANGRLASAGIMHGGEEQTFAYGYLAGSSLLSSLAMPDGIIRELAYEEHRDLAVAISCRLGETVLVSRSQSYDALGRPVTRAQQRGTEAARSDSFSYNGRNELTGAALGTAPYSYSYDNIGNCKTAQELVEELTYEANNLNQYTSIANSTLEQPFVPQYDASGNQTLIKTSTGVWTDQPPGKRSTKKVRLANLTNKNEEKIQRGRNPENPRRGKTGKQNDTEHLPGTQHHGANLLPMAQQIRRNGAEGSLENETA